MKDSYRPFGEGELCGWKTQPRVFIIQTRRPEFARKLRKRQDCSELATVGVNFYLRQFAVSGDWRKIRRLITRYLASAPDQFSARVVAGKRLKIVPRVRIAGTAEGRV